MATTTRVPTGEGTTIQWTPLSGTDNALMVDETIAAHDSDTTYVSRNGKDALSDFYTLQGMPADFDTCIDFKCRCTYKQVGWVDDTVAISAIGIYENDETTGVGASVSDATHPTSYTTFEHASAQADTANKATWDTRKYKLQSIISASGMADGAVIRVTAVEVLLNYNATGSVTVTPPTLALVTAAFAPVVALKVIPGVLAHTLSFFAPAIGGGVVPPTLALTTTAFAPTVTATQNQLITPPTLALATTAYAPVMGLKIIPGTLALTTSTFVPVVKLGIIPPVLALTTTTFAPIIGLKVIPPVTALSLSTFAPSVSVAIVPPTLALTTTSFAPVLKLAVIPGVLALTTTGFAPKVNLAVIPPVLALSLSTFAPTVTVAAGGIIVTPPTLALALTTYAPVLKLGIVPGVLSLTTTSFIPVLGLAVIPPVLSLSTTGYAPVIRLAVIPGTVALTTTTFVPVVRLAVIPPVLALATTTFVPVISIGIVPGTLALTTATFVPVLGLGIIPATASLSTQGYAPILGLGIAPPVLNLVSTGYAPTVTATGIVTAATPPILFIPRTAYFPPQIIDIELRDRLGFSVQIQFTMETLLETLSQKYMLYQAPIAWAVETILQPPTLTTQFTERMQLSSEVVAIALDINEEREEQAILNALFPQILTYATRPQPQREEERRWLDDMRRFLGEQFDRILAVAGIGVIFDDFWDREELLSIIVLQDVLLKTTNRGGLYAIGELQRRYRIGVDWGLVNRQAQDWAGRYAGELAKGITDTTKGQVRQAIVGWIDSGDPLNVLELTLREQVGIERRANLIASTETTRAFARGNQIAWAESGVVDREEWNTVSDERVCPICFPLDNKQNRKVGGDFPGGYYPPAHISCRCFLSPVVRGTR